MHPITTEINTQIETHSQKPSNINNGQCIPFATTVVENTDTISAKTLSWPEISPELPPYSSPASRIFGGHTWINHRNTHFDAEAPTGVDFFWELPLFQKRIAESQYQTGSEILHATLPVTLETGSFNPIYFPVEIVKSYQNQFIDDS